MVTVRQIFYALRQIINNEYGRELNRADYSVFTQKVVTKKLESNPGLENIVLFGRRGFFRDPFFKEELPLGTKDVYKFIQDSNVCKDSIYEVKQTVYSVPSNLLYNHVLFIEKEGFNTILDASGLLRELNLGVMATQGFGTRAAKKLIDYFLNSGIKVYVLHDCDIAGYLIQNKFENGSDTFKKSLDVVEIGLTVEDVKQLGKEGLAETVTYEKNYNNALNILTEDEYDFFVIGSYYNNQYHRVEINALTTPELLDFIKAKIKYEPIRPTIDQIKNYIDIDTNELVKDALFKMYGDSLELKIDKDKLAGEIYKKINGKEHWTKTLERVTFDFTREKISELINRDFCKISKN